MAKRTSMPVIQTPYQILSQVRAGLVTEKQLRAEYTRLRDRAQKQLIRLAGSEYGVPEKWQFEADRGGFWKLSEMKGIRDIAFSMSNIQEFINAPTASISGRQAITRTTVNTLHEHGYTGINRKNLRQFGQFMEKMRQRYGGRKMYPSGDLAQFFSDRKAQGLGVPVSESRLMEAFSSWAADNMI